MSYANPLKRKSGFTLIELMVAVVVLLVVMIAVGRIFSVTSSVSASGVAISETLQQAVAIEQQLREDISKVSDDGFLAIRHVAVPNNIYQYILIDDTQPETAIIRFDQLVFIRLGTTTPVGLISSGSGDFAGQTFASVVYYGHGVSFPDLTSEDRSEYDEDFTIYTEDPILLLNEDDDNPVITPWYQGTVEFETTAYTGQQGAEFYEVDGFGGIINATQQLPSKWMLCRQSTALADDDQDPRAADKKRRYSANGLSTHSIFPDDPRFDTIDPHVQRGRVDIVSTHLGDLRQSILNRFDNLGNLTGNARHWVQWETNTLDQQELIASLLQWPRIEAMPPSAFRNDQMLMMHGLAQGVVSFQIEWMYKEGVGRAMSADGVAHAGYEYANNYSQPWWGGSTREDPDDPTSPIVFQTLSDYHASAVSVADWYDRYYGYCETPDYEEDCVYQPAIHNVAAEAVWPSYPNWPPYDSNNPFPSDQSFSLIERRFEQGEGPPNAFIPVVWDEAFGINEYWTIFGYNGTQPLMENQIDFCNKEWNTSYAWRYTPRPSALRITLRLIDRGNRLGVGWTYQFIVDLPEAIR
jgi:prepilin-type N-terminal cleavage/methylation domain-containing protein